MTDEDQITRSDRALWSPHSDGAIADRRRQAIIELQRRYHCKHFRMTRVDGGIWMEAWHEVPKFEGEFNASHAGKVAVTIHNFRHLI